MEEINNVETIEETEVEVYEDEVTDVDVSADPEEKSGGIMPVVIGGAVLVAGAIGVLLKTKDKRKFKREQKKIRDLQEAGYTVTRNPIVTEENDVADVDAEEDETEEE